MWTPTSGVRSVVDAMNKFTWTAEVLWRKRDSMATLWVREHPDPCLDRLFIAFLGTLHQGRSSFIMHRFALGDCFLQITKKRMLQMQGKKWLNWLHSVFGRFSTDFRKLLQRHALNLCYLNSGWGSFSKSKPQSRLDIMQPCFPTGELIPGLVPVGLGCICHCYAGRFPVYI